MTHSVIIQATSLIQSGDIVRAEALLTALVETEGDTALVEVLDEMPSKDLLAVIREYDASKQSLLNLLITPEQFARAVVLDRLYGDESHEHLRGMINSVLFREDANTSDFINAIAELEYGYEALADYLSDRADEIVGTLNALETEEFSRAEISDHDWKELTWLLRHEHPDIYDVVYAILKARIQERSSAEAELAHGEDEVAKTETDDTKAKAEIDDDEDAAI